MIGMIATPISTKGAGSLPVRSLNADLLKDEGPAAASTPRGFQWPSGNSDRAGLVPHRALGRGPDAVACLFGEPRYGYPPIGPLGVRAVELLSILPGGLEKGFAKLIVCRLTREGFGSVGLVLKRFFRHPPFFFFFFRAFACALNPAASAFICRETNSSAVS
jgi:hypothetical protein